MARKRRALSGAAKNAYLKRAVRSEANILPEVRERLVERLAGEITSLSLRDAASETLAEEAQLAALEEAKNDEGRTVEAQPVKSQAEVGAAHASEVSRAETFDPFSPNVIVVIRTRGREAVLCQLGRIEAVDDLRLLAREQQLGISQDLDSADEIRLAIVAAAERRIANRRAAAS